METITTINQVRNQTIKCPLSSACLCKKIGWNNDICISRTANDNKLEVIYGREDGSR